MLKIIQITQLPTQLEELMCCAKKEGFRFMERFKREFETGVNRFDQAGEALFAVFKGEQLIGVGGINQQHYDFKNSLSKSEVIIPSEEIGRIRRFYIHPNFREQGIATELLCKIEDTAIHHFKILTLYADTERASRFYLACGYHLYDSHPEISHFKILTMD